MGRALFYALPAFAALAAGYQAVHAVYSCVGKSGVDRGCLLQGYFWLTLAALVLLVWIIVQAAVGRQRAGKGRAGKAPAGKGPGGEGQGG